MRNPHGYGVIVDPAMPGLQEHDILTCIHCGSVSMTKSRLSGKYEVMVFRQDGSHYLREAGFCRSCYQDVCPKCDGKPCSNRFRRMDEQEAAARKLICV